MSAFESLVGGALKRPAARVFRIEPDFFAETWSRRPPKAFEVGLRVPSEQEYLTASAEAAKAESEIVAKKLKDPLCSEEQAEAYGIVEHNKKLVTFVVARGVCNQQNVTLPHPYFELPDDEIPLALKSNAINRIFDEIERLAVDQSPVFAEANELELLELAEILAIDDPFEGVGFIKRGRCLRYLKLVLDTLRE